jgi:hypothetical protein
MALERLPAAIKINTLRNPIAAGSRSDDKPIFIAKLGFNTPPLAAFLKLHYE